MGQPQSAFPDSVFKRSSNRATSNRALGAATNSASSNPNRGSIYDVNFSGAISLRGGASTTSGHYSNASLFGPSGSSGSYVNDSGALQSASSPNAAGSKRGVLGPTSGGGVFSGRGGFRTPRGGGKEGNTNSGTFTAPLPRPPAFYTYRGAGGRLFRFRHGLPAFAAATDCSSCFDVSASGGESAVGGQLYRLSRVNLSSVGEEETVMAPASLVRSRSGGVGVRREVHGTGARANGANPLMPSPAIDGGTGAGGDGGGAFDLSLYTQQAADWRQEAAVGSGVNCVDDDMGGLDGIVGGATRTARIPVVMTATEHTGSTSVASGESSLQRARRGLQKYFKVSIREVTTWAFYNDIPDCSVRVSVVFGAASQIKALGTTRLSKGFGDTRGARNSLTSMNINTNYTSSSSHRNSAGTHTATFSAISSHRYTTAGNLAVPPSASSGAGLQPDPDEGPSTEGWSSSVVERNRRSPQWVGETIVPPLTTVLFIEGRVKGGYRMRCTVAKAATKACDGGGGAVSTIGPKTAAAPGTRPRATSVASAPAVDQLSGLQPPQQQQLVTLVTSSGSPPLPLPPANTGETAKAATSATGKAGGVDRPRGLSAPTAPVTAGLGFPRTPGGGAQSNGGAIQLGGLPSIAPAFSSSAESRVLPASPRQPGALQTDGTAAAAGATTAATRPVQRNSKYQTRGIEGAELYGDYDNEVTDAERAAQAFPSQPPILMSHAMSAASVTRFLSDTPGTNNDVLGEAAGAASGVGPNTRAMDLGTTGSTNCWGSGLTSSDLTVDVDGGHVSTADPRARATRIHTASAAGATATTVDNAFLPLPPVTSTNSADRSTPATPTAVPATGAAATAREAPQQPLRVPMFVVPRTTRLGDGRAAPSPVSLHTACSNNTDSPGGQPQRVGTPEVTRNQLPAFSRSDFDMNGGPLGFYEDLDGGSSTVLPMAVTRRAKVLTSRESYS